MNTILVAIDFSSVTRRVVSEAVRLARLTKARIVLVHIIQMPVIVTEPYKFPLGNVAEYMLEAEKATDRHLARLGTKLRAGGILTETVRSTGLPSYSILRLARKRAASYIVLGSHGHSAVFDVLVGSTARGVLKRATCPVVVVPASKPPSGKAKR